MKDSSCSVFIIICFMKSSLRSSFFLSSSTRPVSVFIFVSQVSVLFYTLFIWSNNLSESRFSQSVRFFILISRASNSRFYVCCVFSNFILKSSIDVLFILANPSISLILRSVSFPLSKLSLKWISTFLSSSCIFTLSF